MQFGANFGLRLSPLSVKNHLFAHGVGISVFIFVTFCRLLTKCFKGRLYRKRVVELESMENDFVIPTFRINEMTSSESSSESRSETSSLKTSEED